MAGDIYGEGGGERLAEEKDLHFLGRIPLNGSVRKGGDYGKPVVCAKVPKFQSDLQHGKHCLLVKPSDSTELTQAFIQLSEDRELGQRLGRNLKEKFAGRRLSVVTEEHVKLYRRLLRRH